LSTTEGIIDDWPVYSLACLAVTQLIGGIDKKLMIEVKLKDGDEGEESIWQ
jgi:hypothetical protein